MLLQGIHGNLINQLLTKYYQNVIKLILQKKKFYIQRIHGILKNGTFTKDMKIMSQLNENRLLGDS